MKKEQVLKELYEDEKNRFGEIFGVNDDGILYGEYDDYGDITPIFYRYGESCTKEDLAKRTFISDRPRNFGLTEDAVYDYLKKAFGKDYEDAVCTLNAIFIVSNEEDFAKFLSSIDELDGTDPLEWYEYDIENKIGEFLNYHKIAVVYEDKIYSIAKESSDYADTDYCTGVVGTLIHEVRHCMMDTHKFLSEDEFPLELSSEEEVEDFCRTAMDSMSISELLFVNNNFVIESGEER